MRSTLAVVICLTGTLLIWGCGSGGGSQTRVVFTDYAGQWTGTWHNNTFNSSGPSTLNVTLSNNNTEMDWTIHVEGNVFGGAAPPDETFHGVVTADTITLTGVSVAYGNLTLNIDQFGNVTGSGTNVPSPNVSRFDFNGHWTASGFQLNYTAALKAGGQASGSYTMTKPAPR